MPRRTPLFEAHSRLGARFVEFAGWEMPLSYTSPLAEHIAVRERCGLFDVSHMGEIELRGRGAQAVCQELTVNDVSRLGVGDCQYSLLCNEAGGVVDDLIVYRLERERYLLIVNAARAATDLDWVANHAGARAVVVDCGSDLVLLALQGPAAAAALLRLASVDASGMRPFTTAQAVIVGAPVLASRTGYTGEDGFEILAAAEHGPRLWDALLGATRACGGLPAGLAARDTLRLEAGLPLYGTDMDTGTTPVEAGLGWVVRIGKGPFIGRDRLAEQLATGVSRRLVGLRLADPGVPRHGARVVREGRTIGTVTSGAKSPTLDAFIGLAYVASEAAAPGMAVAVESRGRLLAAQVVGRPFYRRARDPRAREETHAAS
jgi:aminomethyltransferase